jgi:hypothetical protein
MNYSFRNNYQIRNTLFKSLSISLWKIVAHRNMAYTWIYKYTLEKTKGAIEKGQSRETGNIGYTRHRTKTNKTKNITQKTKKMNNTDSTTY